MDDQENKEEVQVKCTDYSLETRMAPRSRAHSPRVFILFYYFESGFIYRYDKDAVG